MSTSTEPRLFALVPCAGSGERSGAAGPKQYSRVAGRSVVGHTLAALADNDRMQETRGPPAPRDQGLAGALARVG